MGIFDLNLRKATMPCRRKYYFKFQRGMFPYFWDSTLVPHKQYQIDDIYLKNIIFFLDIIFCVPIPCHDCEIRRRHEYLIYYLL